MSEDRDVPNILLIFIGPSQHFPGFATGSYRHRKRAFTNYNTQEQFLSQGPGQPLRASRLPPKPQEGTRQQHQRRSLTAHRQEQAESSTRGGRGHLSADRSERNV